MVTRQKAQGTRHKAEGRNAMLDIIFLVATLLFFVAGTTYVAGCRKLQ